MKLENLATFGDFLTECAADDKMLTEQRVIDKVDSKGKRRRRLKCGKGFKLSADGSRCEVMKAGEKIARKIGHRKMVRSKKRMGQGYQRKIERRKKKAMRFRKMMGLNRKKS